MGETRRIGNEETQKQKIKPEGVTKEDVVEKTRTRPRMI